MIKCSICDEMAIWKSGDTHFCDKCVPRGCSCNIDPRNGKDDLDEKGREYPCSDHWFSDKGFE